MRWPWELTSELDRITERLRLADEARREADEKAAEAIGQRNQVQEQLAAADAERKLLLDRIVQLSGQPPIYQKPQNGDPIQREQAASAPAPREVVTFSTVHDAFKQATRDGSFSLSRRPN